MTETEKDMLSTLVDLINQYDPREAFYSDVPEADELSVLFEQAPVLDLEGASISSNGRAHRVYTEESTKTFMKSDAVSRVAQTVIKLIAEHKTATPERRHVIEGTLYHNGFNNTIDLILDNKHDEVIQKFMSGMERIRNE